MATPRSRGWRPRDGGLLGVELDDQLLLDRRVDDLPGRKRVHENAHVVRDDLEPRGDRTLPRGRTGDHERRELGGARANLDDVVLADAVRRDVDLLAVNQHVAVAHELAGGVTAGREARAVDDVVEPALQ